MPNSGFAPQEAAEKLEAARRQGTGWVKVDKDLIARVQSARGKVDAALQKAVRIHRSLPCGHALRLEPLFGISQFIIDANMQDAS